MLRGSGGSGGSGGPEFSYSVERSESSALLKYVPVDAAEINRFGRI